MSVAVEETVGLLVETTRFGCIEIRDDQLVILPEGLIGFETVHEYCLLEHAPGSPFRWLQAINMPELAFVVINPFDFFVDYDFSIGDADVKQLELSSAADVAVMCITTISGQAVTGNLVGPIIVNWKTRVAKQVVLSDARFGTRHSLIEQPENA